MACEIQSADELVLTELIFNGVFSALSGEQIVALTSCFVWSEKSDVGVKVGSMVYPQAHHKGIVHNWVSLAVSLEAEDHVALTQNLV